MEKIRKHHSESVNQSTDASTKNDLRKQESLTNETEQLQAELDLLFPKNHQLNSNINSEASLEKLKND